MLRDWFDRLGRRKEEEQAPPVIGNDGWVELAGGKLIVHDPAEEGRYATLTPEPGVRLWINDEEVNEPTAVTSSDQIRYEVAVDPGNLVELAVSEDEMTVEMLLLGDPNRLPDTVAIEGRHQVRLKPGYSTKAKPRPGNPRQLIFDRLRTLEVTYGIDEAAIDRGLADPTLQPVVIARGQEAQAPAPGQWVWRLDESSLVEAGQVVSAYQGGTPNLPRITVRGETIRVYDDLPEPQVYLAGNGTRIVPGGRLVASASGRARAVPTPQGLRVHIFPVHRVDGDLTQDLDVQADVIINGNVIGAKVTTNGECLVIGNMERSEIRAEVISVRGAAVESRLCTMAPGHYAPLRAELNWVQQRIEEMRESIHNHKAITEDAFRGVQNMTMAIRRKAEAMAISHPDFTAASDELARVFMGAQAVSGLDLPTAGRILLSLGKAIKAAEQLAMGARDVKAATLAHTTVWAGRDIEVHDKAAGSMLFAGRSIRTRPEAVISQSELVAAGDVTVGTLSSVRGTAPVTIRMGGHLEADMVQAGSTFEFGVDQKPFKSDLAMVEAKINAKGQLIIRQKDL